MKNILKKAIVVFFVASILTIAACSNPSNNEVQPTLTGDIAKIQGVWMDSSLAYNSSGNGITVNSPLFGSEYCFFGNNFTYYKWKDNYYYGTFQLINNELLLFVDVALIRKFLYKFDVGDSLILDGSKDSIGNNSKIHGAYYDGSYIKKESSTIVDFTGRWQVTGPENNYFVFSENTFEKVRVGGSNYTGSYKIENNVLILTTSTGIIHKYVFNFYRVSNPKDYLTLDSTPKNFNNSELRLAYDAGFKKQ